MKTKEYNEQIEKYNAEIETENKTRPTKLGHYVIAISATAIFIFGQTLMAHATLWSGEFILAGLSVFIGVFVLWHYIGKGIASIQSSKESNSS